MTSIPAGHSRSLSLCSLRSAASRQQACLLLLIFLDWWERGVCLRVHLRRVRVALLCRPPCLLQSPQAISSSRCLGRLLLLHGMKLLIMCIRNGVLGQTRQLLLLALSG